MSITITQGDYVYYQDTTTGGPNGWTWTLSGGTPAGSTAQNPLVRYLSPSTPGFSTTLSASKTIPGGITLTSSKTEANIIKVDPENINVSLSATPSTVRMSQTIVYVANGPTGNIDYYTWALAGTGGYTGSNATQSLRIDSWLQLTGSESGATYSTYTATSSVTATSILANTATSSANVTYSKNGPAENYNYADGPYTDNVGYYTATVLLDGSGAPITTSALAMPGSGYVVTVDTVIPMNTYPINNQYFRAHLEQVVFLSCSMDIQYTSQYGYVPGQHIASLFALQACGAAFTGWESQTRYTIGNYMLPGDLSLYFGSKFYFADTLNFLKGIANIRSWSYDNLNSIIFNDYAVASQSSRALEIDYLGGVKPVAFNLSLDGGSNIGPGGACLPSGLLTGTDVMIILTIEFGSGGISAINPAWDVVIPVMISPGGSPGHSTNGELVYVEDYGSPGPLYDGIATLINNELTANGYDGNIIAEASPAYAWMGNVGFYDANTFQGLKISIIDDGPTGPNMGFITRITLSDTGPFTVLGSTDSAFPTTPGQSSWLSFYTNYVANPWQINDISQPRPARGWYFGLQ